MIQQPSPGDCLSPEPIKTLENLGTVDGQEKNANGRLERQSTSSASGISTPSSTSREENERYAFFEIIKLQFKIFCTFMTFKPPIFYLKKLNCEFKNFLMGKNVLKVANLQY